LSPFLQCLRRFTRLAAALGRDARSSANIINFMSDGLTHARSFIGTHRVPLACRDFSHFEVEVR
jgi:hypothetical protein